LRRYPTGPMLTASWPQGPARMRRTDQLFQIIQILRRSPRPVTAQRLADELEVSKRTVYRAVADLIGQRVPIYGEPGLGYLLGPGYEMPPLMLTPDEIDAIVLGAQMVSELRDPALAGAANDVIAKLAAVAPEHLHGHFADPGVAAKPSANDAADAADSRAMRAAIHSGRKLRLRYRCADGTRSERIVWPVALGYAQTHFLLIAWCESKAGFRHFRTDRILTMDVLDEPIGVRRGELRKRWVRWREAERQRLGEDA